MICLLRVGFDDADESDDTPFASVPDRLGNYRIERREDGTPWELGRGAMGVTYRAVDTSLQRPAALKLIDSEWVKRGAEARERFMREARTAAALRHPNVATVYHFGIREEDGQCFCAMELVEGETLETRVRRTGPLDALTTVEIALQVGSALAAAEKQGLVHRDLKPANLMLVKTDDDRNCSVKVIDFGVAKALVEKPDAMGLTHGGFVGTPAFASPEQFTNAPVDVRSDIYSLGVTLWYLLTGRMPFQGASMDEIRANHQLHILPIDQLKAAHVPSRLVSLLGSMLGFEPGARPGVRTLTSKLQECRAQILDRWKVARRFALAAGLIAIAVVTVTLSPWWSNRTPPQHDTPAPARSIAVLPFENLSAEKENAFFADGLQDDVLTSLAKIQNLKVISRTSVMAYRGTAARNLRQIGRALGVMNILQGSVRRDGNRVKVNVQLVDARSNHYLWAENYDRTISDALMLQGELATEIAATLQATLSPEEKANVARQPTRNPDAYLLYLRARQLEINPDILLKDFKAAVRLYEQAIKLDPNFALARARLAATIARIYHFYEPTEAWKQRARADAQESLRLQPNLGEGHFALGLFSYWLESDYARALRELTAAQALLPNDSGVGLIVAAIARREGRWEDALAIFQRIEAIDPQNPNIVRNLVYTYGALRRWPEAVGSGERLNALAPNSNDARMQVAYMTFFWKGSTAALETLLSSTPPNVDPDGTLTAARWDVLMIKRDFIGAEAALAASPLTELSYLKGGFSAPKSYFAGCAALARGDQTRAQAAFEAARPTFEQAVREAPQSETRHANLGLFYAFVGRKDEAITEGRRAVELKPESQDAVDGPLMNGYLALIYTRLGEHELALPLLERLLRTAHTSDSAQYSISLQDLRSRWEWDPLRNDLRFQKLITEGMKP
jgi:serine/threonine-protein kinase